MLGMLLCHLYKHVNFARSFETIQSAVGNNRECTSLCWFSTCSYTGTEKNTIDRQGLSIALKVFSNMILKVIFSATFIFYAYVILCWVEIIHIHFKMAVFHSIYLYYLSLIQINKSSSKVVWVIFKYSRTELHGKLQMPKESWQFLLIGRDSGK